MKKLFLLLIVSGIVFISCSEKETMYDYRWETRNKALKIEKFSKDSARVYYWRVNNNAICEVDAEISKGKVLTKGKDEVTIEVTEGKHKEIKTRLGFFVRNNILYMEITPRKNNGYPIKPGEVIVTTKFEGKTNACD